MGEERLNGLALMSIHRDIVENLDVEKVANRFVKRNVRRMNLVLK